MSDIREPSDLEKYLFDLQGFVILKNALSAAEVDACNNRIIKLFVGF